MSATASLNSQHDHSGSCDHSHGCSHATRINAEVEHDPTRTKTLREDYRKEISKRFIELRVVTRETVDDNDALRLASRFNLEPTDSFEFTTDPEAVEAFRDQFDEWIEDGVLEPIGRGAIKDGDHYTATHVRSAYDRGLGNAERDLASSGVDVDEITMSRAFNRPIHRDSLELLYTRNYDQLEKITSDMSTDIGRILGESFSEGVGPEEAGRRLGNEVDNFRQARGYTMARTEFMNANHQGALNRYEELGYEQFRIVTFEPCAQCQDIAAGGPYSHSEVRGLLPIHPNCMCGLNAVIN